MPYTQRQIDRILGSGDSCVLPANAPLTLSQAVSESEVRRRIYSYEDKAARDVLDLFKQAWRDIFAHGNELADAVELSKLTPGDAKSTEWKRRVAFMVDERLKKLLSDCANLTASRLVTAFNAGYFGRAWSADVSTKPDVMVRFLRKDVRVIDDAFGKDWLRREGEPFYESYALIASRYAQKSRQQLNTALINGESVFAALQRMKALLGVRALKEAFWYTQTLTRTAILSAANLGALALFQDNARVTEAVGGFGVGAIFITAGDGRVCPTCRQYAGRSFRVDSLLGALTASMINPPIHENCRCSFVMLITSDDLLPPPMPPGMTWQEWLLLYGLDSLLADFMDDTRGQSTQIGDEVTYADI